ncbi:MAG: toprim domain-containing protein [Anaerobutyricum sp.]
MAHYLVIVESPAKVKTIKSFWAAIIQLRLLRHVRDLPKSSWNRCGTRLRTKIHYNGEKAIFLRLCGKSEEVGQSISATDPDREGEAISWHLATALKLDEKKMRRITFNEITKNAVKASLKAPRDIDMNLVDAQQHAAFWIVWSDTGSARFFGQK